MNFLPYDPGSLPTQQAPTPGETVEIRVPGFPPYKDHSRSIRNSTHRIHDRFLMLRRVAGKAMGGRAWFQGPVSIDFVMEAPGFEPDKSLNDYAGGIMDSLDGSHGSSFAYLPIVYQDDCQVCDKRLELRRAAQPRYTVRISFLGYDVAQADHDAELFP